MLNDGKSWVHKTGHAEAPQYVGMMGGSSPEPAMLSVAAVAVSCAL